jgi:hypothetical protein
MTFIRRYWLIKIAVTLLIMIFLPSVLHAQDPGGGPDDVPVDGGLGILIAAGVGYGVKKYRNEWRKLKNSRNS